MNLRRRGKNIKAGIRKCIGRASIDEQKGSDGANKYIMYTQKVVKSTMIMSNDVVFIAGCDHRNSNCQAAEWQGSKHDGQPKKR